MKKLTAILLILALCLCACGKGDDSQASSPAPQEPDTPSVRFLTTIPGTEKSFRSLAKAYTEQTGVPVEIIFAGDEELTQLLAGPEAPTAFTAAAGQLPLDYALPLDGSKLAGELLTQEFTVRHSDGTLAALPLELGVYGLLVNVTLLRQAGYRLEDIHSFETLKTVAEDIQSRSVALGFDAFTAAGLSPSSLRFSGELVSLPLYYEFQEAGTTETPPAITGKYLDHLRSIFDLYLANAPADPRFLSRIDDEESRIAFTSSLAVFYQGGSWEYAELSRAVEELAVIPIYCGIPGEEQSGLCMDALHHWAVNAQASPEDQAASLDFLYYLVTDRQAIAVMADLFGGICYRSAPIHPNPILAAALEQLAQGRPSVTWAYRLAPNPAQWRRTVVTALTAYAEDPSDKTWAIVTDTIVDGWAYEYRLAGND